MVYLQFRRLKAVWVTLGTHWRQSCLITLRSYLPGACVTLNGWIVASTGNWRVGGVRPDCDNSSTQKVSVGDHIWRRRVLKLSNLVRRRRRGTSVESSDVVWSNCISSFGIDNTVASQSKETFAPVGIVMRHLQCTVPVGQRLILCRHNDSKDIIMCCRRTRL